MKTYFSYANCDHSIRFRLSDSPGALLPSNRRYRFQPVTVSLWGYCFRLLSRFIVFYFCMIIFILFILSNISYKVNKFDISICINKTPEINNSIDGNLHFHYIL